mmetsp:Transcript_621/g.1659  ORF Transcript_621/g.1659 Transcript_621/m.1659 type:complete len:247 (+) Transcript_621:418-1158(+)
MLVGVAGRAAVRDRRRRVQAAQLARLHREAQGHRQGEQRGGVRRGAHSGRGYDAGGRQGRAAAGSGARPRHAGDGGESAPPLATPSDRAVLRGVLLRKPRHVLVGDGAHGRGVAARRAPPRRPPDPDQRPQRRRQAGAGCAGVPAQCEARHPPRCEAGEHPDEPQGRGEARRLWRVQPPAGYAGLALRDVGRHGHVHVSGAHYGRPILVQCGRLGGGRPDRRGSARAVPVPAGGNGQGADGVLGPP